MQTVQIESRADFIDLGVGQPAASLLPTRLIQQAADHRLAHDATAYLQYGAEQGDGYFRELLAQFLSDGYRYQCTPISCLSVQRVAHELA